MVDTIRRSVTPPWRAIGFALVVALLVGVVLGGSLVVIGPDAARAGYLSVMFLLSAVRATTLRTRLEAAGFAVAVALLGFVVGSVGLAATLVALVAVSLVQGVVRVGEVATITRSPVNLVAFAGMAESGAVLWQALVGAVLGAALIVLIAQALPARDASPDRAPLGARLRYGLVVAIGSVVIVVGSTWLDFAFVGWALLSFCMIVAVGTGERRGRALHRVIGTALGALAASGALLLPRPVQLVVLAVATVLCIAYLRAGNYLLFVTFLTPAVLLSTTSDLSPYQLAVGRTEAVIASAVLAVVLTALLERPPQRPPAPSDAPA